MEFSRNLPILADQSYVFICFHICWEWTLEQDEVIDNPQVHLVLTFKKSCLVRRSNTLDTKFHGQALFNIYFVGYRTGFFLIFRKNPQSKFQNVYDFRAGKVCLQIKQNRFLVNSWINWLFSENFLIIFSNKTSWRLILWRVVSWRVIKYRGVWYNRIFLTW